MRHPDDAIIWRDFSVVLRPVVPDAWEEALTSSVASVLDHLEPGAPFEATVNTVRDLAPGVDLLWAAGPIGFHVDTEFAPYTYLLILYSGGLMVEGGAWEPFKQDRAGDMLCLNTHRRHGLRSVELQEVEALGAELPFLDRPMQPVWAALALTGWAELTPPQAAKAFMRAITYDPAAVKEDA